MIRFILIGLHILLGCAAILLALGAFASVKRKGWHTTIGEAYHWVFVAMVISAISLSLMNWATLAWLLPIAIFSYGFALMGYLAAKQRWHDWLRFHVIGQIGSFIACTTAVAVVNFGTIGLAAWVIPTIIGAPIVRWVNSEIKAGRRPHYPQ